MWNNSNHCKRPDKSKGEINFYLAHAPADLVLCDFQAQLLLFGERELFEDDDIAIGLDEVIGMVDHVHRCYLDGLRVRRP